MGVAYDIAANALDSAVSQLFDNDPRVRSVGIGRHGDGYGFHVIRNAAQILPLSATVGAAIGRYSEHSDYLSKPPSRSRASCEAPLRGPRKPYRCESRLGAAEAPPPRLRSPDRELR